MPVIAQYGGGAPPRAPSFARATPVHHGSGSASPAPAPPAAAGAARARALRTGTGSSDSGSNSPDMKDARTVSTEHA